MSLVDQSDEPDKAKGEMTAALVALTNGVQVTYNGENVTARTGLSPHIYYTCCSYGRLNI